MDSGYIVGSMYSICDVTCLKLELKTNGAQSDSAQLISD